MELGVRWDFVSRCRLGQGSDVRLTWVGVGQQGLVLGVTEAGNGKVVSIGTRGLCVGLAGCGF